VRFQTKAPPGSKVFVAGTFNNWDPCAKRLRRSGDGNYAGNLMLTPGRHEYKFVVDDEWMIDSENPQWVPNDMGSVNSVIEVPQKKSYPARAGT
jgi:1,4-alpha-glucan branching enzyme